MHVVGALLDVVRAAFRRGDGAVVARSRHAGFADDLGYVKSGAGGGHTALLRSDGATVSSCGRLAAPVEDLTSSPAASGA